MVGIIERKICIIYNLKFEYGIRAGLHYMN